MPVDFRTTQTSGGSGQSGQGSPFAAATPMQAAMEASGVEDILINYNVKFRDAPPAGHRENEIFTVISQLMMSRKCCSLLVGAPGTGKTRIVEEIARLITNQSPYTSALNDCTVYELPLSALMAGTSYRGQLEEKVKRIIEWCEQNPVILFIDEIHQLCGRSASYDGVAQMLKPAMARGSIRMIGATTLQESKSLLDDPAFSRRFNRVQVCELSTEQTADILEKSVLPALSAHYHCGFAPGIARRAVDAAEKAKTINSHRPDSAITLLDQVCASTVLHRNRSIMTCTDEDLKQHLQSSPVIINADHIANCARSSTFSLPENFDPVKSRIFFRDETVDRLYSIIADYIRFDAMFPTGRPFRISVTGPEKSGRTTLCREAAKLLDEEPVYLDLSDYSDAPSLNRIIGSPLGYVGSDSKQEMPFDIIESNPRKVIILDGTDRCHPVVKDFFESAMSTGLIKYADNRRIDISKCIVFCTFESGRSRPIGFGESRDPVSMSCLEMRPLSAQEMILAAERMVRDMVTVMKKDHPKYASVPDSPEIPEEERRSIVTPADIAPAARRVILKTMTP